MSAPLLDISDAIRYRAMRMLCYTKARRTLTGWNPKNFTRAQALLLAQGVEQTSATECFVKQLASNRICLRQALSNSQVTLEGQWNGTDGLRLI